MGEWVKLKASDGNELEGYVARPQGEATGAVVAVQEIFGVNPSIQAVADSYAKDGFIAIAPALFDRIEKGLQLSYGPDDMKKAFEIYGKLNVDTALLDVAAAFHWAQQETGKGVGVLGFCYGGLMAWLSAVRGENVKMQPACTVGYYAGSIGKYATEEPSCPVQLHFGANDDHIGKDQIDAVRDAHASHDDGDEVEIFVYDGAGHAFANEARPSYVAEAAKLARERSLEFLKTHIA